MVSLEGRARCLPTIALAKVGLNAPLLGLCLFLTGCKQTQTSADTSSTTKELLAPLHPPPDSETSPFELYSTLAGKMARMEELLNAIDRFLGDPDFQASLLSDATEFHELTTECRGLYPEELDSEDQPHFDRAINRTAKSALALIKAVKDNDTPAAQAALKSLDQIRRKSHAKYSY